VLEARTFLDDIGEAGTSTFAPQVRRALAEHNRRVHAHLAGLRHIEFAGAAGDPGCEQWHNWERLQASGAKEIPQDFDLPPVGVAWNSIVSDLDPQSRYRDFEASTTMALRKSLCGGNTWVNPSITFRARESMLIADVEPRKTREAVFKHIGSVQLPDSLLEVDAATHFSEALPARRPSSSSELLAVYGALLTHGTDLDAVHPCSRPLGPVLRPANQPIVLNERQAGVAVEGVEQHNRAEDRIRISLLAVDTHGVTNVAMAIVKLLGFDLCPRLRDLRERKLFVPRGWPVPETIEGVTVRRVSVKAIERGWDDLVRLAASIRAGKVSAAHALHRLGSAAVGDPLHRAAQHLGRLLRTLFLCDYLAIRGYRREIHTLLDRGESVHQLQRANHGGQVATERGRRRQEMAAISGAHALLTNIVLAWNTGRMDAVAARLHRDGLGIEEDWLRRIGPAYFLHINFRGVALGRCRAVSGIATAR